MLRQRTSVQLLEQLQKNTENIRNVCILAHVDHGKTTLADSLVASNGIISQRMAGKLRYMDSRADEQERGITMKSSAISLHFETDNRDYLINLIDSPGHVDFTSEVTTAIRLCDCVIVVVDVVEGVCAQTKVALEMAYREQLHPVLVLNKIDRLIVEKKMTPLDAYVYLTQVLEQVNAVTGEMFTKTALQKMNLAHDESDSKCECSEDQVFDWDAGLDEIDDSNLYFDPIRGNVVFTSATDGWGFSIEDFARIYSLKLGVRPEVLRRTLWGDFYLNMKAKKIQKGAQAKAKKPLFAQLVLQGIYDIYEAVCVNKDNVALEKMCGSLGIKLQARDLRQSDPRLKLSAMLGSWLPVSQAVLKMLTRLPSPRTMPKSRADHLLNVRGEQNPEVERITSALSQGDPSTEAPVIIFVSKMFAVESSQLPENRLELFTFEDLAKRREEARKAYLASQNKADPREYSLRREWQNGIPIDEKPEPEAIATAAEEIDEASTAFVGFARIFSGTVRRGAEVFVLGPKHDPQSFKAKHPELDVDPALTLKDLKSDEHVTKLKVDKLYLMMGRELADVDGVPAGNILGIGGALEHHVAKYSTLCSSPLCPPFTDMTSPVVPILRVALEPKRMQDMPKLIHGMKLLNQADPCVQVILQGTGERVLVTAGEVHLERCLLDLRERFAKIDISVSAPIVPFRETVVEPPKMDMVNELIDVTTNKLSACDNDRTVNADGSVTLLTPSKQSSLTIRAAPLPEDVALLLEKEATLLRAFDLAKKTEGEEHSEIDDELRTKIQKFRADLKEAFDRSEMEQWKDFDVDRIWSFGPKKCGPNILINDMEDFSVNYWQALEKSSGDLHNFESNLVFGFQLATLAGPLCEEPLRAVAFRVSEWKVMNSDDKLSSYGPLSGQIMSTMKDCCRKAFQAQPQRLMAAMYKCNIQVTADALRKMYSVVNRRHGRIVAGDLVEGSSSFEVSAVVPVVESFQLANEMRKQTSGLAQPQLIFSHWEVIDVDPFWVPRTQEELSHFGEKADSENRAMKYMNQVRRRKGLKVNEHVVEHGEKQRTLSKKK
ncbi:elongation factor-like GTPase 1 [Galendromus occidentalis]|uniref:Ribosome assembly protein 1 n=1 Tax=Galendromus occidentalis TaxID=34638 RepID=A0AAJ7SF44_9ACAR|nr:elongation factor-like GTPase 1 [Galendromus occidentalis]